jgi:3,4-dihydroxy 2-butanone 4-phosphate synthase/GTP cyclohydrolase II
MSNEIKLDTIEEAIAEIKKGKLVIVVDDEDRENEGDFLTAARNITPEMIAFMAKIGGGLICAPLTEERCRQLGLDMMVENNTETLKTAFTVSVDLKHRNMASGISARDRAATIQALISPETKPDDLARPGHIFPLKAHSEGVLRRAGHTEAAIDMARLAGFEPAGAIVEIMKDDGTMARLPDLMKIAKQYDLKIVSIEDLIQYRLKNESLIDPVIDVKMPTSYGDFELHAYRQKFNNEEHLALVKGKWNKNEPIMVRVHSSCITGDIFGSCRCDCGEQLHEAMRMIEKEGKGVILYLNHEGRGIGLFNKLRAYKLQEQGMDTFDANIELGFKADERDYGVGAQILRDLNVHKMRLISNNPTKRAGLTGYGLEIVENIPLKIKSNKHNSLYLETKKAKMGHEL